MQAGLAFSVYVPMSLRRRVRTAMDSFPDKKRVACPVTLTKIERVSLGFNALWLFADSSCTNRKTSARDLPCSPGAGALARPAGQMRIAQLCGARGPKV